MSDKFINQLPAAGALDGTEPLPIMQGGTTVQTPVSAVLNQPTQTATVTGINSPNNSFNVAGATLFLGLFGGSGGQIQMFDGNLHNVYNINSAGNKIIQHYSQDDTNTTYVTLQVNGTGGANLGTYKLSGLLKVQQAFGCNGATPQTKASVSAAVASTAATNAAPWGYTTQAQADGIVTLLNQIRAALVANGIAV